MAHLQDQTRKDAIKIMLPSKSLCAIHCCLQLIFFTFMPLLYKTIFIKTHSGHTVQDSEHELYFNCIFYLSHCLACLMCF